MSNIISIKNISDEEFIKLVSQCKTKVEIHSKLNLPINGNNRNILNQRIKRTNAKLNPLWTRKYPLIKKECPVCKKIFETSKGSPKEKTTCSHSCSNSYFRSGLNNSMYQKGTTNYRTICFNYHKKECVVCGEKNIVAVHHFDGNHDNNEPSNLIPLCPTHHVYIHSKFSHLIIEKVNLYLKNFFNNTL